MTKVREAYEPDGSGAITDEFSRWIYQLDRLLVRYGIDRGLFDASTIEEEFEAGHSAYAAATNLAKARSED
jgi:hypothetical protein